MSTGCRHSSQPGNIEIPRMGKVQAWTSGSVREIHFLCEVFKRNTAATKHYIASHYCHSPLPVWVAIADEWGSEEAMGAACDSPNGISTINLKTLSHYLK